VGWAEATGKPGDFRPAPGGRRPARAKTGGEGPPAPGTAANQLEPKASGGVTTRAEKAQTRGDKKEDRFKKRKGVGAISYDGRREEKKVAKKKLKNRLDKKKQFDAKGNDVGGGQRREWND